MGLFDFRDVNKRKKKTQATIVQCDPKGIRINDTHINFPTTYTILKDILGNATRVEPIKQTKNNVYLWDDLGIYCSSPDPQKMLMLLFVTDIRYGLGHQPLNNFKGSIFVDGETLNVAIQNVDESRPYMLRSILKENNQVAIALGWNPVI